MPFEHHDLIPREPAFPPSSGEPGEQPCFPQWPM